MRKLALLLTLLLLCALPALADTPSLDEALVGEWVTALVTWYCDGSQIYYPWPWFDGNCVITQDGQVCGGYLGQTPLPLLYDDAAGQWYVQGDDRFGSIYLNTDQYGQLVMRGEIDTQVLLRADAAPAELPPAESCLAYGGTWELTSLYFPTYEGFPAFMVEPVSLGLPALTLTLSASLDAAAIDLAFTQAVSQQAPGTLLDCTPKGCELLNRNTLLVYVPTCTLVMTRTAMPEVDEAILSYAQQLAGHWRLDGITVGGIPLSPDAFDVEDFPLFFDELGNAQLGDVIHPLQMASGNLLLGSIPLRLDGGSPYLEIADGVALRFVPEADWYRAQLNGEWRLDGISVPSLDIGASSEDAGMNVRLIIATDDTAVLRHDGGEMRFTLQHTDDVTGYRLIDEAGDVQLLTIARPGLLSVTNDTETYSLSFVPAE